MSWRRSSFCDNLGCIEIRREGSQILIRDSKDPASTPLRYTFEEWRVFIAGVMAGEFDDLLDPRLAGEAV